jgi:hypothetical protein
MASGIPAAAASPINDRSAWDRQLAEYRRQRALMDANYEFGALAKANREFERDKARIDRATMSAEWDAIWARLTEVEQWTYDTFVVPTWRTAADLANIPAPDFDAVAFKIELIKAEDLNGYDYMKREPFDIIAEDIARLAAAAASH